MVELPQMMGIAKDMEGSVTEVCFVVVMDQHPGKDQQDAHCLYSRAAFAWVKVI